MRRSTLYGLVAIAACYMCTVVTACTPSSPSASSAVHHSSRTPSADDRLAIATSGGVVIWSANAGVHPAGLPVATGQGVHISLLTWSSDGRYLAWMQEKNQNETSEEVVSVDTKTNTSAKWPLQAPPGAITFDGSTPVTIDADSPFLRVLRSGGASSQVLLPSEPDASGSFDTGFVYLGEVVGSTPVPVWRTNFTGRASAEGRLPGHAPTSSYEMASVSADGKQVAVENGDHTDVCGVGPSSRLYLLNTGIGTGSWGSLPVPHNTTWRFANMTFGVNNSTLDLVAYNVTRCDGTFPTTLFEVRDGHLVSTKNNVLQGQRGPAGQLAIVTGADAVTLINQDPGLVQTGRKQVVVEGKRIALSATPAAIAWAPRN